MRSCPLPLILILISGAALVGCTGTVTRTTGAVVIARQPPPPRCAWYTPMTGTAYGQVVTVAAEGPACRSQALIKWIALKSSLPWASTSLTPGTLIAQMARGGTVIKIYQQGSALPTDQTAGYLADAFADAGWTPQPPTCGQPECGPPLTPPESTIGG